MSLARPWAKRSVPWVLAALAIVWALWPSGLQRYAAAGAYMDAHTALLNLANVAQQVSDGAAATEAAALRMKLSWALGALDLRGGAFAVLGRADRHWAKWQATILDAAVEVGSVVQPGATQGATEGPIAAPDAHTAQELQALARGLQSLAADMYVPWEPVNGTPLYRRSLGSYLDTERSTKLQADMDALREMIHAATAPQPPNKQ